MKQKTRANDYNEYVNKITADCSGTFTAKIVSEILSAYTSLNVLSISAQNRAGKPDKVHTFRFVW